LFIITREFAWVPEEKIILKNMDIESLLELGLPNSGQIRGTLIRRKSYAKGV
jgi:hypothetical protein